MRIEVAGGDATLRTLRQLPDGCPGQDGDAGQRREAEADVRQLVPEGPGVGGRHWEPPRVGIPDAAVRGSSRGTQAAFSQRQSSGIVGRFPVARRPARKIFAVAFKRNAIVAMERRSESATCHAGGSETRIRMNIVIGV